MKPARWLLLLLATSAFSLVPTSSHAQTKWSLSPGIKLGYTFGSGGGFTIGGEVSAVAVRYRGSGSDLPVFGGPVINLDYRWGEDFRLRLGGELGAMITGVEGGAVVAFGNGAPRFGFAVTPWVGGFIVPYWTFTFLFGEPVSYEQGCYFKMPLVYDYGRFYPLPLIFMSAD